MQNNVKKLRWKRFLAGHEEELFSYYYETMGDARSYGKLQAYCATRGWVNSRTHKAPTAMALWFSMWRWAIRPENRDAAYQIYQNYERDDGRFCTPAEWDALLDERAMVCLSDRGYEIWREENVRVS